MTFFRVNQTEGASPKLPPLVTEHGVSNLAARAVRRYLEHWCGCSAKPWISSTVGERLSWSTDEALVQLDALFEWIALNGKAYGPSTSVLDIGLRSLWETLSVLLGQLLLPSIGTSWTAGHEKCLQAIESVRLLGGSDLFSKPYLAALRADKHDALLVEFLSQLETAVDEYAFRNASQCALIWCQLVAAKRLSAAGADTILDSILVPIRARTPEMGAAGLLAFSRILDEVPEVVSDPKLEILITCLARIEVATKIHTANAEHDNRDRIPQPDIELRAAAARNVLRVDRIFVSKNLPPPRLLQAWREVREHEILPEVRNVQ